MLPASRTGVLVLDGAVSILMISSAACIKKLSALTLRNWITLGKKVIVSISQTDPVLEK